MASGPVGTCSRGTSSRRRTAARSAPQALQEEEGRERRDGAARRALPRTRRDPPHGRGRRGRHRRRQRRAQAASPTSGGRRWSGMSSPTPRCSASWRRSCSPGSSRVRAPSPSSCWFRGDRGRTRRVLLARGIGDRTRIKRGREPRRDAGDLLRRRTDAAALGPARPALDQWASGLEDYVFGMAAAMTRNDLAMIGALGALGAAVLALCWKELKLYTFDLRLRREPRRPDAPRRHASSRAPRARHRHRSPAVGVVLMVALLVTPGQRCAAVDEQTGRHGRARRGLRRRQRGWRGR